MKVLRASKQIFLTILISLPATLVHAETIHPDEATQATSAQPRKVYELTTREDLAAFSDEELIMLAAVVFNDDGYARPGSDPVLKRLLSEKKAEPATALLSAMRTPSNNPNVANNLTAKP